MTQDYPTAPLASKKKPFGTEAVSHADTPTAPCEECHIPIELDTTPRKTDKAHLCGSCRQRLSREKWEEPTLNWKSQEARRVSGSRDW